MYNFIVVLIAIILGGGAVYIILRPRLKSTIQYDTDLASKNQQLQQEYGRAYKEYHDLKDKLILIQEEYKTINTQKQDLLTQIDDIKSLQQQAANGFYQTALDTADRAYQTEVERISQDLDDRREAANQEYLTTLAEAAQQFTEKIAEQQAELNTLTTKLQAVRNNVDLAIKAAKQKMAIETKQDYYRICLSEADQQEIAQLRKVPLRDSAPVNKVIYKVYYEKPLTAMIGRVVGTGVHTGIYKITNINNQMCYVGQAVDIATRWKTHCKRGVGAEGWTQNKLYPAMYAIGVENFTFEILEECPRAQLDTREDYWQEYFHAKDFGYSVK